jgi:hypothetical protein
MHALPYENESVLIYGYDKRQFNTSVLFYIDKWTESMPESIVVDWLAMSDKWCIAPSFFGNNAGEVCQEIMRRKLKLQYGI